MPDMRILLENVLLSAVDIDGTEFLIKYQNLAVYHTGLMAMLRDKCIAL